MKIFTLILASAAATFAGPVTLHPNQQASFPAPVIPVVISLDLTELEAQNPQYLVHFNGGLVGLFANEWDAPVWTTPKTDDYKEWPNEERWVAPVIHPLVHPVVHEIVPPYHPPIVCWHCAPEVQVHTAPEVPEPATWILMTLGVAVLLFKMAIHAGGKR